MKTRFLILTVITSIIFIACQKEDESENPYNNLDIVQIELTAYEKSFITINVGDTLFYTEEWINKKNTKNLDLYYIVGNLDSVIKKDFIQYSYNLDFHSLNNTHYKLIYTKDTNGFDISIKEWTDGVSLYTIENVLHRYDTLTINNILYNDVYHIEKDSFQNDNNCLIHRAFFAPNYGLVLLSDKCNHLYFYNL